MTTVSWAGDWPQGQNSSFYSPLCQIWSHITYIMYCKTRFNSQLLDHSGAINSGDPCKPLLRGPKWLWRKPAGLELSMVLQPAVRFSTRITACESNSCMARGWCSAYLGSLRDPVGNDDTPSSSTLKFKEKLLLYTLVWRYSNSGPISNNDVIFKTRGEQNASAYICWTFTDFSSTPVLLA